MIIDAGNANFHDTRRRAAEAEAAGSPYLGIGVSGGEEGARHGPSIMGGGPKPAWDRVAPILEAIAARFDGTPCATWMGPDGAGHFVKTVHNGIEYADMQMIAEVYGIMRDGLGMGPEEVAAAFERWNQRAAQVLSGRDHRHRLPRDRSRRPGAPVVDIILDRAGQKGTGRWTAIEAQHLGAPGDGDRGGGRGAQPVVAARGARRRGGALRLRTGGGPGRRRSCSTGSRRRCSPARSPATPRASACSQRPRSSSAGSCRSPAIARVWRAGCIIRSAMLDDMAQALEGDAGTNLMFAPRFADRLKASHGSLRAVVAAGGAGRRSRPRRWRRRSAIST